MLKDNVDVLIRSDTVVEYEIVEETPTVDVSEIVVNSVDALVVVLGVVVSIGAVGIEIVVGGAAVVTGFRHKTGSGRHCSDGSSNNSPTGHRGIKIRFPK